MDSPTDQGDWRGAIAGVLAEFADAKALVVAARAVRQAGYTRCDAHSPFPVHGIDPALGIRRTRLPWLVFGAGLAGGVGALLLQWWTNAVDYQILISGKPLFSLPANIPVTFELIVLLSALAAFGGVFALTGLPQFAHPVFSQERFRRATTTGFFLSIDARDELFDEPVARQLLRDAGATAVESFGWPAGQGRRLPSALVWLGAIAALLAVLPPLYVAKLNLTRSDRPRVHLVPDMDYQPKYKTQAASALFDDGRTMRTAVAGTIAQGAWNNDTHRTHGVVDGAPAATFPAGFDLSEANMRRGQERFNIFCAACHGYVGDGNGLVSERALARADSPGWVPPLSLHAPSVRGQPVGQIFGTITHGIRSMPGYAAQIEPADRWAIILYVRALQRSQNASIDDVPEEQRARLRPQLQGEPGMDQLVTSRPEWELDRAADGTNLAGFRAPLTSACAVVGMVGLGAGSMLAWLAEDGVQRFFHSYLVTFCFLLSISLGALFFVATLHLCRAGWGVTVRRLAEILASNLIVLAVLFLPILGLVWSGSSSLYAWVDSQSAGVSEIAANKARYYLNPALFATRCVGYFVVWGLLAGYFLSRSRRQDDTGQVDLTTKMESFSAPALLLFSVTVSFASFDLLMSLDPHWFSTIFGVYFFSGAVVGGLAALIVLALVLQAAGWLTQSITREHYHELGKLLFGFIVFWGYIAFSQYMLIWYANIPEETTWYLARQTGPWVWVSLLLLFGHLLIPFFGLLPRIMKRQRVLLGGWAVWMLVMHWLDIYWLVMPGVAPVSVPIGWLDLACLVGLAGFYLAGALWLAGDASLVPTKDPRLHEALAFHNP